MKKTILSAALALSTLAFTSCLSSDGENKSEGTLVYGGSMCFNYVTNAMTNESFISTDPQYIFNIDYTNQLITPSMSNIELDENLKVSFKLPTLKVNVGTPNDDYSYACSGSYITPENNTDQYVFDNFSFKAIDRAIRTANGSYIYSPVYNVSYTINSRYKVVVLPTGYNLLGTTTSIADGSDPYTDKQAYYSIELDLKTKKAKLILNDATFASGQSTMKLLATDLPFEIISAGANPIITITTEPDEKIDLKDYTGKVEGAYFSDINIRINTPSSYGSSISFKVNINGLQGTSSTTEYDVTANLSYYPPKSND